MIVVQAPQGWKTALIIVILCAQFRRRGKEMVDLMCGYYQTVHERPVRSQVEPGYLRPLLPAEAPEEGESFDSILSDVQSKIMPGVCVTSLRCSVSMASQKPCSHLLVRRVPRGLVVPIIAYRRWPGQQQPHFSSGR